MLHAEITEPPVDFRQIGGWELTVLLTELKHDLNLYLASTDPMQVRTRTLADVIAFNERTPRELALFGQELFVQAQAKGGLESPAYKAALANNHRYARAEGIDQVLQEHKLDALVAPVTVGSYEIQLRAIAREMGLPVV